MSQVKDDLTINRLRESPGCPKLKATAAAVRECVPFALEPAKRHHDGSRHDQQGLVVFERLQTFYATVKDAGFELTVAEKKNLVKSVLDFCLVWASLPHEAGRSGTTMQHQSCICGVMWEGNKHRVWAILVCCSFTETALFEHFCPVLL